MSQKVPEEEEVIPGQMSENLQSSVSRLTQDEKPMLKRFTTSMIGQLITIWYELHIIVKHDVWNEFGAGNVVKFPITIIPRHQQQTSADAFPNIDWLPDVFQS